MILSISSDEDQEEGEDNNDDLVLEQTPGPSAVDNADSKQASLKVNPSLKPPPSSGFKNNYIQWAKSLVFARPEAKAFNKAKDEIAKSMDVLNVIRRFKELYNLKECLLTEEQRAVFNHIPKPYLIVVVMKTVKQQRKILRRWKRMIDLIVRKRKRRKK